MPDEKNIIRVELGELTPSCFVIMPFAGTFRPVYEKVIRPAVEEAGLECRRADELFSTQPITRDIWKQIRSCRLVLAELSGRNPNVLYELGLAHAIGKPAIIITNKEEDVPFDLKALRYRYYDTNNPFWGETLKQWLTEMCKKVVEQDDFGSVFEGISPVGDLTFSEMRPAPVHPVKRFDITGAWEGHVYWEHGPQGSWSLHLLQTDEELSGSLVYSVIRDGQLTVVQQDMVGMIIDDNINLQAVAYSFLQQGTFSSYALDRFVGILKETGDEIEGEVSDESGDSGALTLNRVQVGGSS